MRTWKQFMVVGILAILAFVACDEDNGNDLIEQAKTWDVANGLSMSITGNASHSARVKTASGTQLTKTQYNIIVDKLARVITAEHAKGGMIQAQVNAMFLHHSSVVILEKTTVYDYYKTNGDELTLWLNSEYMLTVTEVELSPIIADAIVATVDGEIKTR